MATINGTTGNDTLTGTAGADNINGLAGNDVLNGQGGNDQLFGDPGDDELDSDYGYTGADTMAGGPGNDFYGVDDPGDKITELPGEGADRVEAFDVSYTLGPNVENLNLRSSSESNEFNGIGNAAANIITCVGQTTDGGNFFLSGLDGNDTLKTDSVVWGDPDQPAGTGNDTLDGGAGADVMEGYFGNDIYYVDNPHDSVIEYHNDVIDGIDEVRSTITYTLGLNLENLTLTGTTAINGTGNALANDIRGNEYANVLSGLDGNDTLNGYEGNDTLIGGNGNDTLYGWTGIDSMTGGMGNDLYYVENKDDKVIELASQGTDTVSSNISHTLATNVENLTLAGTAAINGTGNATADVINGNNAANVLNGLDGNDTLNGYGGNDTLYGWSGRLDDGRHRQ
jgi:Ca2+-binding RTX toxin-like protein